MSLLSSTLKNIINGNIYCCLCLTSLDAPAVLLQDEIFLENFKSSFNMFEILARLLGTETLNALPLFSALCEQCKKNASDSFQFIKMCEEKAEKLRKTIDYIYNNLVMEDNHGKSISTMFLFINTDDFACDPYYDDRKSTCRNTALLRFQTLLLNKNKLKSNIEAEGMSYSPGIKLEDDVDRGEVHTPRHKSKKPRAKVIPTSDMMFGNNKLMCKICRKSYASQQHLRQHFFRIHAPKKFQCEQCSRSYGAKALLDQHRYDSHTAAVCSECGKTYKNRYSLKTHELGHKTKLICTDCGRSYKHRKTYIRHLELKICEQKERKSTFEGKFICDICGKNFCHKSTLRVHIQFEHGTGKAHTCPWCFKRFFAQSRLKAHIVTHTQEKKFTCEMCGGKFVTKESLLYHTRIHTGERPYECHLCDNRFLSTSRRAEHVRRHHMTASYECDICHSKFKERAWLLKHKKRHLNPNSRLHYPANATEVDC